MAILVYDCPHCGASKMTFTGHGSQLSSGDGGRSFHWNTLFACRKCREGIVAKFSAYSHTDPQNSGGEERQPLAVLRQPASAQQIPAQRLRCPLNLVADRSRWVEPPGH